MKNWKTTLAGIIVAGLGIATTMGWITPDLSAAILTIATAVGFITAKDNDVSGK